MTTLATFTYDPEANVVVIQGRLESEDGNTIGDLHEVLRAGEDFDGLTFEDMAARGSGTIDNENDELVLSNSVDIVYGSAAPRPHEESGLDVQVEEIIMTACLPEAGAEQVVDASIWIGDEELRLEVRRLANANGLPEAKAILADYFDLEEVEQEE